MRASYSFYGKGDVVCVVDLNEVGCKSVTNDIENVVDDLRRAGVLAGRRLIYRDSLGIWDGVTLDDGQRFAGFYTIGERSLDAALEAIRHD